jgi:hypothetical protein
VVTASEVLDLFAAARTGSRTRRARALAQAARAMASLSADEKRDLAALIAERAAPQLVSRIDAEAGLDLTSEQVNAVITMAERIDPDELATLRSQVRDRERRGQALRALGGTLAAAAGLGSAVPATAAPFDDTVLPPPDPALLVDGPEPSTRADTGPLPTEQNGADVPDSHDTEPVSAEPPTTDPSTPSGGVPAWAAEASEGPAARTAPRPFESVFDRLPVSPRDDPVGHGTPVLQPDDATDIDLEGDLTARVRAAQMPLVEDLRVPRGNGARLAVLRRRVGDLAAMDPVQHTAIIAAIPDGWARRRAIELLIAHGDMAPAEAALLIGKVGSHQARAWLSASAIEAGLLTLGDAAQLIDERALARLARRYG